MVKKTVIQIHDDNESGLSFVDNAGVAHKYSLHTRTIYFTVNSLAVFELFGRASSKEALPAQVTSRAFVKGFATLGDRDISIIGNTGNWATRVAISIKGRTAEEHEKTVQAWNPESPPNEAPDCDALLGFMEYGAKEEHWWITLRVAETTLNALAQAVKNNQVHSLQIGVSLENIYTDAGWGELNFEEPVHLFLRPSISSGDVQFPEIAFGQINTWNFKFTGTSLLSDPFSQELPPASDTKFADEPHGSSDTEKILSALERLTASVGAIRSSVIRIGWIIAAALIVSALVK